ncbi:C-type lectin domain family 4 member G-like isoform X1 [Alosa sapidissima]|uniref:C-type lectin domain family 4 member G-like isoform X1 n=1 Tax=Alosa sapidissima TaxID=34773 RepID=UPI001C09B888|nr:C-type lectin domain family 4 member G-like isoform X1 [Alosa sapidissima]
MVNTGQSRLDSDQYDDFNAEHESMDNLQKVSLFTVRGYGSSKRYQLATGVLGLISAALLMAVIGMAIQIKGMGVSQSSLNFTAVRSELKLLRDDRVRLKAVMDSLQHDYDKARSDRSLLQAQLDRESAMSDRLLSQIKTLEEQKKREDVRVLQLVRSCGRCPPGWEVMNDTCYYFPTSSGIPRKGWDDAKADCIRQGGNLATVDTLLKQTFLVGVLRVLHSEGFSYRSGFWIGLRQKDTEGAWHWTNGSSLGTGYWMDGEPNDDYGHEDCAATYPTVNILKSWNDAPCRHPLKWICEKEATATS